MEIIKSLCLVGEKQNQLAMRKEGKKKVLFVGSFNDSTSDGSVGGQMFASKTLINSDLKNEIDFILIDSTADSVPAPPVYKRIGKVSKRFFKLVYYLVRFRPDFVLLFSSAGLSLLEKGSMAIVAKFFFSKVVFAPRSGLIQDNVSSSSFYRNFIKVVLSVSDKVICQGTSWSKFYQSLGKSNSEKFFIIPNWIDSSVYLINRPNYAEHVIFAEKLIYIGWVEEYKGIFDLIEAVFLIREKIPNLTVNVYGSGKMLDQAKLKCKDLGIEEKISFKGWANQSTKLEALRTADMFILPSHKEGFPNALIEALASGVPSIATNVGGVSDILINYETGLLVEPKQPEELSKAILEMYSNCNLRKKLSKQGRERVEELNSLQGMYRHMKMVFEC